MDAEQVSPRSLSRLLDAVVSLGSELDLQSALHRIVETGVELADARYGALGVLNEDRSGLSQFVTVGIDPETTRRIGALPKGLGLLGAVINDAAPVRVANIREDSRRSGFPPGHPAMTSFLGVPIRVRGDVYGNLYLTDKRHEEAFTDVDEELVVGLASAAAGVIDNARLFHQLSRRNAIISATQEVAQAVLRGADPMETLQYIAQQARLLASCDVATFALPSEDGSTLRIEVAAGELGAEFVGRTFPRVGSVSGEVIGSGHPAVIADLSRDPRRAQPQVSGRQVGPAIFAALSAGAKSIGTLFVGRSTGAPAFMKEDVETVLSFAAQAGVVLENASQRQQLNRLSLLEDRERIARDLHDTVIQQIFAVGLSLDAVAQLVDDRRSRQRIVSAVDELDTVIRRLRTVIFEMNSSPERDTGGLLGELRGIIGDASRLLGFEPALKWRGAVDPTIDQAVATTIAATVREALSNIVRHAHASNVTVEVAADDKCLRVVVTDDGIGIPDPSASTAGNGLRNLRSRAEQLGGSLRLRSPSAGRGTVLEWSIPLGLH